MRASDPKVHDLNLTPPPMCVDVEQMVLGALLLGQPSEVVEQAGGMRLFYDDVHKAIYKLIRRLEANDSPVTPVTVAGIVGADLAPGLEELGGKRYIARMAGNAIAASQIDWYVGLLAEDADKRVLYDGLREANADLAQYELTAADIAAKLQAGLTQIETPDRGKAPISMMVAATKGLEEAHNAYSGVEIEGVPPGIGSLQKLVPFFGAGELWLLGGRPSMGKTGVAISLMLNAARIGHPVIFCSYEMLPQALAQRAISEETSRAGYAVSYQQMRTGEMNDRQMDVVAQATRAIGELPIQFLSREYRSTKLITVGVKQSLRKIGPTGKKPLIIVDYAQLMQSDARSRYEQITEISMTLKALAMHFEVPVIALSQLSRQVESREDKRPMMSDLRESGQLEQDADGVMFCYRDEYYVEREEPDPRDFEEHTVWETAMAKVKNRLEVIVAKQRQGQIGTARMRFNPAINRIWED